MIIAYRNFGPTRGAVHQALLLNLARLAANDLGKRLRILEGVETSQEVAFFGERGDLVIGSSVTMRRGSGFLALRCSLSLVAFGLLEELLYPLRRGGFALNVPF